MQLSWTLALSAALVAAPLSGQVPGGRAAAARTPGAHLGALAWPEAEARLREAPLVIVPFGAGAKEHGPHLPMSTDRLMLEVLMQAAVDSLPVVVAPPILHGWFPAFRDFPGTEISDADLFRRTVEEVARSLVRHWARRIVFLNTGITYSTGLPIAVAAREIHQREGVPTLVISWGDLETEEVAALAEQKAGGHADEMETSVVLHLRPDLVHMELAPTDYGPPGGEPGPGYRPGGFSRTPGHPEFSTTGILGDATLATAEKGRKIVEIMTREWIRALRAFATEPVTGQPLEGTEWVLAELEGDVPPAAARATLLLDRGALGASGSGGCNQLTGSYDLTGGRLTFGTMASTRRACPGPLMALEDRCLGALGRVGGYRLVGAGLELLGEAGTVARFRAR